MIEHESYLARRWRPERLELAATAAELLADTFAQAAEFARQRKAGILGDELYRHFLANLAKDMRLAMRVLDAWEKNSLPDVETITALLNAAGPPRLLD